MSWQADTACDFPSTARLIADVQDWINAPDTHHGWMLIGGTEATSKTPRRFGSRESLADSPRLLIEVTAQAGLTHRVEAGIGPGDTANWKVLTPVPSAPLDTPVRFQEAVEGLRKFYRVAIVPP